MSTTVTPRPPQTGTPRAWRTSQHRPVPSTLLRLAALALVALACYQAVLRYGRQYTFFDMKIYHGAMVWWTHGQDLYAFVAPRTTLGFTYPPFAALAMAPIALVPVAVAGWVNLLVSVAALGYILDRLVAPLAERFGQPRWFALALAVELAAATEPVRETLGFGQVNLLLAALIFLDLPRRRKEVSADLPGRRTGSAWLHRLGAHPLGRLWASGALVGVGVGLATAIKVTPALFIVYFLTTRQWRPAIVASITAIGATVLTFLVMGTDAGRYFTSVLLDAGRIGEVDATANQSLAGLLARLYDAPATPTLLWLAFAALLLGVGLARARCAHQDSDEVAAFTIVGLTANAVSPISWSHHLVFLAPALLILVDHATARSSGARRSPLAPDPFPGPTMRRWSALAAAAGIYLLLVTSPLWHFEHKLQVGVSHYHDGLIGVLGENSLALLLIGLVAALPWRPAAGRAPAVLAATSGASRPATTIRGY